MPNLNYPTAAHLDEVARSHPDSRRILEGMRVPDGRIRNLYRLLGWSTAILRLWGAFAKGLRADVQLPPYLRELMICRIVQAKRCRYALGQHRRLAVAAGANLRLLDGIAEWKGNGLFRGVDRLFLQLADELAADGHASRETMNALRAELGEQAVVEALVTGSFYLCCAAVLNSLDPDPEHDEI